MTTDNARYNQINIPTFNQSISTTAVHLAQRTRSTDYKTRLKLESPHSRSHWPAQQHFSPTVITEVGGLSKFSPGCYLLSFQFTSPVQPRSAIPSVAELSFSSCDLELWPMTLTFEPDLQSVKVNRHAKHQKLPSGYRDRQTDRQTHTHTLDGSLYQDTHGRISLAGHWNGVENNTNITL